MFSSRNMKQLLWRGSNACRLGVWTVATVVMALLPCCAAPRPLPPVAIEERAERMCRLMPDDVDRWHSFMAVDEIGNDVVCAFGGCGSVHRTAADPFGEKAPVTVDIYDYGEACDPGDLGRWGLADAAVHDVRKFGAESWGARLGPGVVVVGREDLVRKVVQRALDGTSSSLVASARDLRVEWTSTQIVIVDFEKREANDASRSIAIRRCAAQRRPGGPHCFQLTVRGTPPRSAGDLVARVVGQMRSATVEVAEPDLYVGQVALDGPQDDRHFGFPHLFMATLELMFR